MDDDHGWFATTKPRARRSLRTGIAVVALAAAGLLTAACGGGSSGSGVASTRRTTTTLASPPAARSSSSEATTSSERLRFSACMRSHGVPKFPDPGANGAMLHAIAASGINTHTPGYRAALRACKRYTPAGHLTPAQIAADNAKGLRFSQCMRAHGVPSFPDPSTGPEGAGVINLAHEHIDPSSPRFQAAQRACEHLLPGGKK